MRYETPNDNTEMDAPEIRQGAGLGSEPGSLDAHGAEAAGVVRPKTMMPPRLEQSWRQGCAALDRFISTRAPRPVSSVLVMLGVCVLLGLGLWQTMRLHEKNAILQDVHERLAEPPRILTGGKAAADIASMVPVSLHGSWQPLRMFRLAPRTYMHQNGYQLIIPFRLQDGDVVFVNRGFVPEGVSVMPPAAGTPVSVQGVAYRPPAEKPRFAPENNPAKGEWVWLDIAAMAHETGMGHAVPVVVYENRQPDSNSYPIGGQLPLPYHNRHQQYAVTWYCMALALIGVWLMAIGKKPQNPENDVPKQEEEPMDPVARRDRYPEATD